MKMYVTGWNRLKGVSKKTGNEYDFYQVDGFVKRFEGDGNELQAYVYTIDSRVWNEVLDKAPLAPFLCSVEEARGRVVDVTLLKCENISKVIIDGLSK